MPIRALVWGENVHERENADVRALYPDGMHATIAAALNEDFRDHGGDGDAAGARARAERCAARADRRASVVGPRRA